MHNDTQLKWDMFIGMLEKGKLEAIAKKQSEMLPRIEKKIREREKEIDR